MEQWKWDLISCFIYVGLPMLLFAAITLGPQLEAWYARKFLKR